MRIPIALSSSDTISLRFLPKLLNPSRQCRRGEWDRCRETPTADLGEREAPRASSLLAESLANVGRELGADRVYVFENIRDPDGRLWMNLTSEWLRDGTRALFDAPGTKLHPYSPDFTRWIEVLGDRQVLT